MHLTLCDKCKSLVHEPLVLCAIGAQLIGYVCQQCTLVLVERLRTEFDLVPVPQALLPYLKPPK